MEEKLNNITLEETLKIQRKNYWKNKIKKHLPKPLRYINSTILCLRFPFLYPRNRWTGKHYNNWKLFRYHENNWEKAYEWNDNKWVIKNKWVAFKIKVADYLNSFFGIFHFLPLYTELDAMPKGWRKCFGIQMCKEIKQALLEHGGRKFLKQYRITQIKEKWGCLCWYDSHSCEEVFNIIHKYDYISRHTCINCGRTAKYISSGWISPYCENCIGDKKDTAERYFYDIPFYGVKRYSFNKDKKEETDEI